MSSKIKLLNLNIELTISLLEHEKIVIVKFIEVLQNKKNSVIELIIPDTCFHINPGENLK
ncbi:hypothetical protein J2S19_004453 [Metabacillus malikii]|uniref:Uncharacterized protein n=1 Tax=Metabacillus malikii TaxID=1504265 RepID=A0ABT9ZLD2_9BACI|nr:hypothetical protein [Metabacillus malikii]